MKTRAAILRELKGPWEVVELDLDGPRQDELTVRLVGSGLCHSEQHIVSGAMPVAGLPICGGHEGAGVVVEVGPHTPGWSVGDRVAITCLPSCGRCRWCASGLGNLCDLSAHLLSGARFDDPTSMRMSLDGQPVGQFCSVSCFSELTTIGTSQAVKVPDGIDLDKACLLGCAVLTGWGSAALGEPEPGHTVIVMGAGGVGSFAVQGALHAGATNVVAVDPEPRKLASAEALGATHTATTIAEGARIARRLTHGQGADSTIVTVGSLEPQHVAEALASVRKAGTVVVAALGAYDAVGVPVNMFDLSLSQKRLQGSMFGGSVPHRDMPRMLDMYARGQLKLDEVVTRTYTLDQVNEGYADLDAGDNVRGVITF